MRNISLSLALVATILFAGTVLAHSVITEVTPSNIDQQPLVFGVKVADTKDSKDFEISVAAKNGKLPPPQFLVPKLSASVAVKRVDREGGSVVFSFRLSPKELEGARFSVSEMGFVKMLDATGKAILRPMPSANTYAFLLTDFIQPAPVHPQKPAPLKAVYLVSKQGGDLSADDLKRHPEVKAVHSFADLQHFAGKEMAVWIDVSGLPLLQGDKDREWVIRKAQEEYTFAMIGCNEFLWCFRDKLDCFGISGPGPIDWTKYDLAPGFCVIRQSRETLGKEVHVAANGRAYKVVPTVEKVLKVTDRLLAGKAAPETP